MSKLLLLNHGISPSMHHKLLIIKILVMLSIFNAGVISVNAQVISCTDYSGKTIFTDNESLCNTSQNGQQDSDIKVVGLSDINVPYNCGKKAVNKHKVDYCSPKRSYYQVGNSWHIYVEKILVDTDKANADKAINKLEQSLNKIMTLLPRHVVAELKKLDVYLMKGEKSGVDEGGMSYIRPGEARNYHYLDPRWQHAIVVYSAKTLMYLDDLWTKKALMHELAHAWHISNWPQKYAPIYQPFLQAKNKGLYLNIDDYKGRKIQTAYAIKNQLEYFAELSAMYFVGGNYYPYNAATLKEYDLAGYQMVEALWQ